MDAVPKQIFIRILARDEGCGVQAGFGDIGEAKLLRIGERAVKDGKYVEGDEIAAG
jgi:hypothetical protein